jgi:hypothetical protein
MLGSCHFCGTIFKSYLIDYKDAYAEIVSKASHHISKAHSQEVVEYSKYMSNIMFSLNAILTVKRLLNVPATETQVVALLEQERSKVLEAIYLPELDYSPLDDTPPDNEGEEVKLSTPKPKKESI